ncbi:BTAD domain-containing putative transcriptional regulator [Nocardioides panaciterrulae]|uniref:DNA-binding SARP family transcriptional activator n=1 Tax=Nocardioides panaciterrulae TaxID=661492 RepID=A0A7Y9E5K3_9ACTN|nr:DNA-binding SARP family transcriptional activator [Nocardioides panaciterrulae]
MEVAVLGPVEVTLQGAPVDLGTPKQRALVAALALSEGRPVSVDGIVDLLWGDHPPGGVTATLQAYVSGLRRVLEPDRPRRAPATVLVTVAPGYALRMPGECVDAARFERTVTAQHLRLQPLGRREDGALTAGELEDASARLDRALAAWRGTPYAELGDADAAVAERARLEELRAVALEDRAQARLALGLHATVAGELEALTTAYPLRERLWALRALALTRAGRQAEALDVLRRLREVLDDELGLEPSAELRELQTAVLRQDPALDWVAPPPGRLPPAAQPSVGPAPAAAGPAESPEPPEPREPPEQVAPWPMVGRDRELARLLGALADAEVGTPSYAALTGEPGIGKSRLAAELVARARARGVRVLVGRCTQDDGAPPLWPWASVLAPLGGDVVGDRPDTDEGGQFRAWERITRAVRDASREEPLLVVLDDLHWADASTLRVLRLLAETAEDERLLVLATWRDHPRPAGALADVVETLARRHAVRLELRGLEAESAARVVGSLARTTVTEDQARDLRERTDGNPFFLVEFARLAGERTDLDTLLAGEDPPTAVSEVLGRRLARLPEETVAALRTAAVIGRQFESRTLARAARIDEDDLLDVVEPAQVAGLVREDGVDRWWFAHALVRDTLLTGTSATRRARTHARVAEVLGGTPGRETEVARHWLGAGPAYADRAWRAALAAAEVARRLHAHDEAGELLTRALEAQREDPAATARDRYDLLLTLIEAWRWAAQLPALVRAVEDAIEVGTELHDPEAVARAAIATSQGVLWRSAGPGEVNDTVVGALRSSLERLPGEDSELRCRTMLALANELFNEVSFEERQALVEEALAMAGRLGEPALRLDAHQIAFVALWVPQTAEARLVHATEAMELARSTGDDRAFVVSATLRAAVLSELGRPHEMRAAAQPARAEAARLRILFGELVLDGLELPWDAMAGRFEECDRALDRIRAVGRRIAHSNAEETLVGSLISLRLWQGRPLEMVPALEQFDATPYPFAASVAVFLWRAGEHDRARAYYAEHGAPLAHDTEISMLAWCHAAELALHLGDAELGGGAYPRLAPFAGMTCCAGSALANGPVDAYLAMAAAATGETGIATRHADAASALAERWEIPVFAAWFTELRQRHAF